MFHFRYATVFALLMLLSVEKVHSFQTQAAINVNNGANGIGGLSVSQFDPRPEAETPGNVGLCFSGGGSRALSAVMGQIRALHHFGYMSQVKALSSVSGGSWGSVPFTYLPDSISDDDLLGPYIDDASQLCLGGIFSPCAAMYQMDQLGPNSLGNAVNDASFDLAAMAVEGAALYSQGVPADRLWTHLVGTHVLKPFGLASFDSNNLPTGFFCPDTVTCDNILANNPQFTTYYKVRSGPNSIRRPFHIINTAMFVEVPSIVNPGDSYQYLAPFHATPYFAGVVSTPPGASMPSSSAPIGGGTVQSYAFNSQLVSNSNGVVSVTQECPFALSDITGASSSFFAEVVQNDMNCADGLDPAFNYWSPGAAAAGTASTSTKARFSDGGTLDNTGVCAMLAYSDIDKLVVFINTDVPLKIHSNGDIETDTDLPPLFGYQPYNNGYSLYPSTTSTMSSPGMNTEFRFNQVFESSQFQTVLNGLYQATTANGNGPINSGPCVFLQKGLQVLPNSWWGVQGGKQVDVLWVYLQKDTVWENQLDTPLSLYLTGKSFPWYSTSSTYLGNVEINLLAHFTSYVVAQSQTQLQDIFSPSIYQTSLFADSGKGLLSGQNKVVAIAVGASVGGVLLVGFILAAVVIKMRRQRRQEDVELEQTKV